VRIDYRVRTAQAVGRIRNQRASAQAFGVECTLLLPKPAQYHLEKGCLYLVLGLRTLAGTATRRLGKMQASSEFNKDFFDGLIRNRVRILTCVRVFLIEDLQGFTDCFYCRWFVQVLDLDQTRKNGWNSGSERIQPRQLILAQGEQQVKGKSIGRICVSNGVQNALSLQAVIQEDILELIKEQNESQSFLLGPP
jgi:hypothetical protein